MLKLTNISASIGICCLFYFFFLLLFYLTFTFHFTYLYFTFTFQRNLLLWCLFYMVYPHPGCWVLVHFHVWLSKGTLQKHTGIISPWSTIKYYIKKFTFLPPPPSPLLWWFDTWNFFSTNSFRKKVFFIDTTMNRIFQSSYAASNCTCTCLLLLTCTISISIISA